MLALVQQPDAKAGFMNGETLWAVIEEKDLLRLFTLCDEDKEPRNPHPFIRLSFEKMLDATELGIAASRTIVHTLVLHQKPSARVDAMLKVISKLRSRAISFSEFSRRYRNKGWPQVMRSLAKKARDDEISNLAVGMLYMVVTPEQTFETLRAELRSLGVTNSVEAIERFVEYISEIPEEEFDQRDLETTIGKKLVKLTSQPTSYVVEEAEAGFLLTPDTQREHEGFIDLYGQRGQGFETYAVSDSIETELLDEDEAVPLVIDSPNEQAMSTAMGTVDLRTPTTMPAVETPNVDEDIEWEKIREHVEKKVETRYIERKRKLNLDDDGFIVRFVRAFIGLANRVQKDNHRGMIIIGTNEVDERHDFWDDASYQDYIDQYIRPRPEFTFQSNRWKSFELGVFLIQPVGRRPYVVAKDVRPRDDSEILVNGECYMREGTQTIPLDEDGMLKLQADLVVRYGRM